MNDLTHGVTRSRLAWYGLLITGLAVAEGWFSYLVRQRLIGASRQFEYLLWGDFFRHLERLPVDYFQGNRTGDLMSRATSDINAVRMMMGPAVMYFARTALGFVIAIILMIKIDARLTLLALLPLPFVTIATRYFGQSIHDRFERIQAQLADMSAVVQEALAGVRVVRAYRQEPAEIARFRAANDEYVERNRGLIRLQAAFYPSLGFFFGLSALVVLWLGGRDVIARRLTLGEFVAFSRYLVLLSWPMIAFGWVINLVQRGLASWERVLEVLDAVPEEAGGDAHVSPGPPRIEVRRLTYRYSTGTFDALEDVSFVVQPGETVAIVGATGAGKSTLVGLLPRLYEPPVGTIFINGVDIRRVPLSELRALMAIVPQEPLLFSQTIGANIAFGLSGPWGEADTRARVIQAATAAGLDAEVTSFRDGYDTVIGERGITLSGGQKQRAAIARALALDAPILVLDDALSAVNTATEETILGGLRRIRQSRTCLIVAHRVSTVRDADRILVLSDGRLVEEGTHDALVARGGPYADMCRRQALEEEIAAS